MIRPATQPAPRKDDPSEGGYRPVATYMDLRQMVFHTDAGSLGPRRPDTRDHIWGMVIETGYPDAVATTIVLADGTMSLYFSSGGGLVGLGDHEHLADAGQRLLGLASLLRSNFDEATDFPLPRRGRTRTYLMAYSGVVAVEFSLEAPWKEPALLALGERVQELFAMIRMLADQIAEQREGQPTAQPHRIN